MHFFPALSTSVQLLCIVKEEMFTKNTFHIPSRKKMFCNLSLKRVRKFKIFSQIVFINFHFLHFNHFWGGQNYKLKQQLSEVCRFALHTVLNVMSLREIYASAGLRQIVYSWCSFLYFFHFVSFNNKANLQTDIFDTCSVAESARTDLLVRLWLLHCDSVSFKNC